MVGSRRIHLIQILEEHATSEYTNILNTVNPLNVELNPICHLLALLGARHILHVSRIRVKGVMEWQPRGWEC